MKVHATAVPLVITRKGAVPVVILALALGMALSPRRSDAVTSCKVHVSSKTGLIDVFASGIAGTLLWGDRSGSESITFANAATCIAGSTASKCEFGAPGSVPAITPPDLCTVYLKDSGAECAAYIKGCTPGTRPTDQAKADALAQLVAALSFHHSAPTIEFSGVNVQIDSGSGATDGPVNGTGNLIIGYNATTTSPTQSGSHNLVVGDEHTFTSYGGLVAGHQNSVTGVWASVSGGSSNTASGFAASVSGGFANTADGVSASISGGDNNRASSLGASVSGGDGNTASGPASSVTGGSENTASWLGASVTGGNLNTASGPEASVCGGERNAAVVSASSVSGGDNNVASGPDASVSGGARNVANGAESSISGGLTLVQPAADGWAAGTLAPGNVIVGDFESP
jgi:hypothetical protein